VREQGLQHRARKAEEAYNEWIHELRDKAFVELRLEDKF